MSIDISEFDIDYCYGVKLDESGELDMDLVLVFSNGDESEPVLVSLGKSDSL